ncbi:lipoprotein [Spiroplasma floricola]|uniref:Lipoprotein n=2 Tax=Spiroplasma floricola 23-6 TaxID=1336749 RepID=A0A2K8SDI3_9MOLU|nr:lipoprotein [Spiroplasma floricola]AUB31492.1 hypothetical protein SFLOR_v1c04400 [Spiroplasma floricola 23-6]
MKKLLTVLGSLSLVGSTSVTVVSCKDPVTPPKENKTKWSDEDILQRLGNLKFEEMNNGDIKMISKDNHFEIWSGSENGNKYERVITKDNVENSKINYFYNSLLPTDVSYEKPFGIELMSSFYIGKNQEEVKKARSNDIDNLLSVYGSEMTNDMQWKLRGKNAFSIYFGLLFLVEKQVFKCSNFWSSDVIKVKTNKGKEIYLGLSSFYVDYFIGYVTTNLSKWIKEFFEENKELLKSPDLKVEEIINEKSSIVSQKDNQHLNLRILNANFKFTDIIQNVNGEKRWIRGIMESFFDKKVTEQNFKYKKIDNSSFKDYVFNSTWDDNDINKDKEKHYNGGYEIMGPNNEKWEYNSKIYIKIDLI